jgi:hypothetical protein
MKQIIGNGQFHKHLMLLRSIWFNTPQLAAENWGCGGFVPPCTQRFQREILNTQELAPGLFINDNFIQIYPGKKLFVKADFIEFNQISNNRN